jgi:hypothetical protein
MDHCEIKENSELQLKFILVKNIKQYKLLGTDTKIECGLAENTRTAQSVCTLS